MSSTELPNKGMKKTSVEHIGRSQLIPGVGRSQLGGPWCVGQEKLIVKSIEFRSEIITLPTSCACCGSPATTSLRISKKDLKSVAMAVAVSMPMLQRTLALDVPYCAECKRHVNWKRSGEYKGLVYGFLTTLIFAGLGAAILNAMARLAFGDDWFDAHPDLSTGIFVMLAVASAAAVPAWNYRLRPRGPLGRGHARDELAVGIVRVSSSAPSLRFYSDRFADEVMGLNPGAREAPGAQKAAAAVRGGGGRRTSG